MPTANASEKNKKYVKREQRFSVEDLKQLQVVIRRIGEDDGKEFFADLVDISRRGLKIQVPICIGFAEELHVLIKSIKNEVEYEGICIARHMRSVSDGIWEVGCSLEPELSDEVINFVVGVSGKERRGSPRISLTQAAELKRQGQVDGVQVTIRNISLGGYCLHIPEEHDVGEKVKLQLEDPDGNEHSIAGRIRWQNKVEDGYLIGCSFVDSNSHLVLLSCLHKTRFEESMNWWVIAAALFAMFLPPAVSLMMSTDGQARQSNSSAVASLAGPNSATASDAQAATKETSNQDWIAKTPEKPGTRNQPKKPTEVVFAPSSPDVGELEPRVDPVSEQKPTKPAEVVAAPEKLEPSINELPPEESPNPTAKQPEFETSEPSTIAKQPEPTLEPESPFVIKDPVVETPEVAASPLETEWPDMLEPAEPSDQISRSPEESSRRRPELARDPLDGFDFELPEREPVVEEPVKPSPTTEKAVSAEPVQPIVEAPKVEEPSQAEPIVDAEKTKPRTVKAPKVAPPKFVDPDMRVWRHHTGLRTLKAKFIEVDGDEVVLQTENGKKKVLPYDWFSVNDLLFLGEISHTED
jgi:hypothetical protein